MRGSTNRRGALTPLEQGLIGCGSLALLIVICSGVAVYYAVQNAKKGMSSDPAVIRGWLQAEVKCDPPKGYECLRGANFSAMGSSLGTIVIAPPDAKLAEGVDIDPTKTTFMLMKGPMIDQSKPKDAPGRTVTKSEDCVFTVGEKKAKGTKREVTINGEKQVEYQVPLRKTLLFLAVGPADKFDKAAMDDFLKTMRLDVPFDLPTEIRETK